MAYYAAMTWQDHLTDKERAELAKAERKRDLAREDYNAIRYRLKNRAESRIRLQSRKSAESRK